MTLIPLVKNIFNVNTDKEAIDILNEDVNVKQTLSALVINILYLVIMADLLQVILRHLIQAYNTLLNLDILLLMYHVDG